MVFILSLVELAPPHSTAKKIFVCKIGVDEIEVADEKSDQNNVGRRMCSQKLMSLTEILLYTLFYNSALSSWLVKRL